MKMKLKNTESKFKNLKQKLKTSIKSNLTFKNLIIFFISFFAIGIIIGIIFYLYLSSNDKSMIKSNLYEYFTIPDNYNYLSILKKELITNITNTFFIWILGISVIGVIVTFILYFIESFSLGFSCAGIIDHYGFKGILGIFSYIFPGKIIYIINFILLSIASINFSIKLIRYLFMKKEFDLKKQMSKYFKILVITTIITIIYTLLEVFVSPIMIKFFTNL